MRIDSVQVLGLSSVKWEDGKFILDKPCTSEHGPNTHCGEFATFSIVDGNLKEELSQTQILGCLSDTK